MNKKTLLTIGLFTLLLSAFFDATNILRVNAQSLPVHNLNTGVNYATIQGAIDDPLTVSGNTILVDAGTYPGEIFVNKTLTLVGANPETTIIDGQESASYLFHVIANDVVITNFTLRDTNPDPASLSPAVRVYNVTNVVIENLIITATVYGVQIRNSNFTTVAGSRIFGTLTGIYLHQVSYNETIVGNTLDTNPLAIDFASSESKFSSVFHNNFVNNTNDVALAAINYFDDGYPRGGNYWSKYAGTDLYHGPAQGLSGSDGIGDTPYNVIGIINDNYPLMGNFSDFSVSSGTKTFEVDLVSNSTVSAFQFSSATRTIQLSVFPSSAGTSFSMISISYGLIYPPYNVTIVGQAGPLYLNDDLFDNGTFRWMYFTYNSTASTVTIQSSASIRLQSPTELAPAYMRPGTNLTVVTVYTENNPLNMTIEVFNVTGVIGNLTITSALQNGTDVSRSDEVFVESWTAEGFYDMNVTLFNAADLSHQAIEADSVVVDVTAPTIGDVSQNPPASDVHAGDAVTVNVEVTDALSGLKQVTLSYITDDGSWTNIAMTNLLGDIYNATIPGLAFNTNVTYAITAEDNANNTVTTQDLGYMFHYRVIPEFPTTTVTLLFMAATLLAAAAYKEIRFRRRLT